MGISLDFLIGLAAITAVVAGLCYSAYDISSAERRLRRRLDLVAFGRRRPTAAGARQDVEWAARLTTTALRGPELEFARQLEPLHIAPERVPRLFLGLRLVMALAAAVAAWVLLHRSAGTRPAVYIWGAALLCGGVGWLLPPWIMARLSAYRSRSVARGLPEAIELLVVAVEAGLSLEAAIDRVIGELRRSQPAVAAELTATSADLKILPSRDEALRRLADRVSLPAVQSVVVTLSQTLQYGTPLAQGLRVAAAELRNEALLKLEEQANRLPVLLTIPMMLFIMPCLFLIIGGPAFLNVLNVFYGQ